MASSAPRGSSLVRRAAPEVDCKRGQSGSLGWGHRKVQVSGGGVDNALGTDSSMWRAFDPGDVWPMCEWIGSGGGSGHGHASSADASR